MGNTAWIMLYGLIAVVVGLALRAAWRIFVAGRPDLYGDRPPQGGHDGSET
ncbi:hypothetical protein [Tateyamaria sp. SN6-1]|uniref:hypothetical protein n=1 Tax=Tateyamaria sp. SN6-1 TaxID=3092148 RepID=UPI0039F5FEE0